MDVRICLSATYDFSCIRNGRHFERSREIFGSFIRNYPSKDFSTRFAAVEMTNQDPKLTLIKYDRHCEARSTCIARLNADEEKK